MLELMHFDSKQERCEFTRSLCALIYKFRLMTHTLHYQNNGNR